MLLTYKVPNNNFLNINQILKQELQISSRLLQKLIKLKQIYLNGQIVDTRISVEIGDIITIDLGFDEDSENIIPTNIKLNIIYEDKAFLVINKPAGIAIHPSKSHYQNSLSNGVKFYFNKIGLNKKIRPVNRLDFDTSGLVIFAKNQYVQECLISQMKQNIFIKEYLAIANGIFKENSGIIDFPIARKENSIIERCISNNGQKSITHYQVIKQFPNYALVKCILETGRTHQIRVHMSAINHGLLGDTMYGITTNLIKRQALHSNKVSFIHPISKEKICFECSLPYDIKILCSGGNINE